MNDNLSENVSPLKRTMNPKNRGNIAELGKIEIEKLTPREQVLLRIINELEEQLEQKEEDRNAK